LQKVKNRIGGKQQWLRNLIDYPFDHLLQWFGQSGNIPASVAFSQYPAPKNIPLHSWSFLNRTVCFLSGTMDARGFRQWQKANRKVKKGAKAIYILAPMFFKKAEEGEEIEVEDEQDTEDKAETAETSES
jgi:hypothetical protein